MIYITQPGDTLMSLAYAYYGPVDAEFKLEMLIAYNRYAVILVGNDYVPVQPYAAIYLPDDSDSLFLSALSTLDILNSMPLEHRMLLRQTCMNEIDPALLIASYASGHVQTTQGKDGQAKVPLNKPAASEYPSAFADSMFDVTEKRTERFKESVSNMDEVLSEYAELAPAERRFFAAGHLKPAYKSMLNAYHSRVRFSLNQRKPFPSLRSMQRSIHTIKGFSIMHADEIHKLTKVISCARWLGRGCLLLDIGIRSYRVYEAYKHHENWQEEAAKQIGGLSLSLVLAGLVGSSLLMLTPIGWGAIIITAAVAAGGSSIGEIIGDEAYKACEKFGIKIPHINSSVLTSILTLPI